MLGIELSRLSAVELKRLLDVARSRQQDALAQLLLAELNARHGRLAGMAQPEAISATPPLPAAVAAPRRKWGVASAVAASAAAVGAVLAWGVSTDMKFGREPEAQPVAMTTSVAAPRIAVALTRTETVAADTSPEAAIDIAPEPARLARAGARPTARRNPCLDLPTARERLVCGYPSIAIQERRLKDAYSRAVAAGADPRAVESAQAEWNANAAEIQDRKVLNDRYERRVRELEAAAAALQPPI